MSQDDDVNQSVNHLFSHSFVFLLKYFDTTQRKTNAAISRQLRTNVFCQNIVVAS